MSDSKSKTQMNKKDLDQNQASTYPSKFMERFTVYFHIVGVQATVTVHRRSLIYETLFCHCSS